MERPTCFRNVLNTLLKSYREQKYSYGQLTNHLIVDQHGTHFLVITEGWERNTHIHHILIHLMIQDNKIHIIQNATERDLEKELMENNVQPFEIVPAHLPPALRHLIDYAVT
ncbi:MAG TPA: element excision factor XisI family protein [Blastocatellia bacterium]|nr:element excision factor XisI family protein [Blastocatellia bacterium]